MTFANQPGAPAAAQEQQQPQQEQNQAAPVAAPLAAEPASHSLAPADRSPDEPQGEPMPEEPRTEARAPRCNPRMGHRFLWRDHKLPSLPLIAIGETTNDLLADNSVVRLESMSSCRNLRIKADGCVDGLGGWGGRTKFVVLRGADNTVRFQLQKDPSKFLRINAQKAVDGLGQGGPYTVFSVIDHGNGVITLRSKHWGAANLHVGILPEGTLKKCEHTALGIHGRFRVHPVVGDCQYKCAAKQRNAAAAAVHTDEPKVPLSQLLSDQSAIRLVCASTGNKLRVHAKSGLIDGLGGCGKKSLFVVELVEGKLIRLRTKGGKCRTPSYLRINPAGELDAHGQGGRWCLFQVIEHEDGLVSLRSHAHWTNSSAQLFVGVLPNGSVKQPSATRTGVHGRFSVIAATHSKKNSGRFAKAPRWVAVAKNQQLPFDAVLGGQEQSGMKLYVCRVLHNGSWHPGKFNPANHHVHIAYADQEVFSSPEEVQVLCCSTAKWQRVNLDHSSKLPPTAFIAGSEVNSTKSLYAIRWFLHGGMHCGKYGPHLAEGGHLSYGGRVVHVREFELLVL